MKRARLIFRVIGTLFGLMALALTGCATGQTPETGPAVKAIVPPKPVYTRPVERQDFHMVTPRRWVAERGYFETVYQQARERGTVSSVLMSPDGRHVVIFQQQDVLFLSTETGEVVHRLLGAHTSVGNSKFSYDSRYFVTYLGRVDPTLKRGPGPNQINTGNQRLMIRIDLADGFGRKIFFPNEEMCRLFPDDCKKSKINEFNFANKDVNIKDYVIDIYSYRDKEAYFYLYNYVTGVGYKFSEDHIGPMNDSRNIDMKIPVGIPYFNAEKTAKPDEIIDGFRRNCMKGSFNDRIFIECGSLHLMGGKNKYFIMTYDYIKEKVAHLYVDGYGASGLVGPPIKVKGNHVLYMGGAETLDSNWRRIYYSYQVFETTPELKQVFRKDDVFTGPSSEKKMGIMLREGDDDTLFTFTPGPDHEIVMSDLFLNTKRRVRVPFAERQYQSQESLSISSDGKTMVGHVGTDKIHLIQLP